MPIQIPGKFPAPYPAPVDIRKAGQADADAISALLRESFAEFEPLYTPAAFAATVLAPPAILARLGEGPVWIAESAAAPIGTVGAIRKSGTVTVRGMAVSPRARGLGIGKRLLDQVEQFAAGQSALALDLYTTAFLLRAIALYRSAGFRFTGQTANPHGTELLRMEKSQGTTFSLT
ncbi:MAG: GNAT family N-acetyltransferase [Terracidiphilus sp.]